MLHKILLIAKRDYVAVVMRKAFLIGLVAAPLLFGGGFLGIAVMRVTQGASERHVAIIDHTGAAAKFVVEAAREKSAEDRRAHPRPGQSRPTTFSKPSSRTIATRSGSASIFRTGSGGASCSRLSKSGRMRCARRTKRRETSPITRTPKARPRGPGWPTRSTMVSAALVWPSSESIGAVSTICFARCRWKI